MISQKLKAVILKTLELEDYDFRDEMRADEVPGWDSLSHVHVILAVEKEYGIRLMGSDLLRLKCVGDLQKLVDSAQAKT